MSDVEYAALIYEISENIQKTDLEFLKFVYRDQLAMGNDSSERKRITTVRDLFLELEKKKLLGIDRVDLLEEILTHEMMKMRSLLTKVEEFKVRRKVHVGSYQKQSAAYPTQQPAYLAQPQPMQYGNGYAPLQQAGPLYVAGQFGTPPPPYSERPNNLFSSAHVMQGQNPLLQQQPSYPRLNQHPPFSGGGYTYQKMPFFPATTY